MKKLLLALVMFLSCAVAHAEETVTEKGMAHCVYDFYGKRLVNGDCAYIVYNSTQKKDDLDVKVTRMIVKEVDPSDRAISLQIVQASNAANEKESYAVMSRIIKLDTGYEAVQFGKAVAKDDCWFVDDKSIKLCVTKNQ